MTERELVGTDISFERDVIASGPGVRQRALAIQALVDFSEAAGVEVRPEAVEQIRGYTKKEAKAARKALIIAAGIIRPTDNETREVVEIAPVEEAPIESAELVREVC